jgi:hypothetical protein
MDKLTEYPQLIKRILTTYIGHKLRKSEKSQS